MADTYNYLSVSDSPKVTKVSKPVTVVIMLSAVVSIFLFLDTQYSKRLTASGIIVDKSYQKSEQRIPNGPVYPAKYILSVRVGEEIVKVHTNTILGKNARAGQSLTFFSFQGGITHYSYYYYAIPTHNK